LKATGFSALGQEPCCEYKEFVFFARGEFHGALSRIENPSVGTALAESYTALQFFAWDEPTEGIQPSIIKDIGRVIRMLAGRGNMAILLCEQYYDFAEELADDYLVMERGEVIAMGLGSEMQSKGIRQLVSI